jgi:predicted ribosome quality control (RQC) complex YloA/Tae2 family protein
MDERRLYSYRWGDAGTAKNVQELLKRYYSDQINQESFRQLQQKLNQKITSLLTKLQTKAAGFQTRLAESAHADRYKEQGDLLMPISSKYSRE